MLGCIDAFGISFGASIMIANEFVTASFLAFSQAGTKARVCVRGRDAKAPRRRRWLGEPREGRVAPDRRTFQEAGSLDELIYAKWEGGGHAHR